MSEIEEIITFARKARARVVLVIDPTNTISVPYWARICYGPEKLREAYGRSEDSIEQAYHKALQDVKMAEE